MISFIILCAALFSLFFWGMCSPPPMGRLAGSVFGAIILMMVFCHFSRVFSDISLKGGVMGLILRLVLFSIPTLAPALYFDQLGISVGIGCGREDHAEIYLMIVCVILISLGGASAYATRSWPLSEFERWALFPLGRDSPIQFLTALILSFILVFLLVMLA